MSLAGKKQYTTINRNHPVGRSVRACYMMTELGGATAHDLVGGPKAVLGSGASWTKTGLALDGTSNGVAVVPSTPSLSPVADMSIIVRCKCDATGGGANNAMAVARPYDGLVPYQLYLAPGSGGPNTSNGMRYYVSTFSSSGMVRDIRNDGLSHHIVGTYSSSGPTISLYIDGVLDSSATSSGNPRAESLTSELDIGYYSFQNFGFAGSIDYVVILDRCMSAADVARLYGDEFGFLMRRRAVVGKAPSASFNPAWARGSNQLLGGIFK